MSRFRVALLGGFEIRDPSGIPLKLATRKAQGLVAYLASRAGVEFERDKLAGLLWGERDDERARNSLRQTLFQLRRVAQPPNPALLRVTSHTVAMNPAAAEVDVQAFEQAARSDAATDLEDAATLYRGDLLDGFTVDESPFEEWLLQERERLRELAMQGLGRLLQCQRSNGQIEDAIRTCRRLLVLEPWQEPVHRTLMRLLQQAGQPTAALRHYQQCREILSRDLGVEPEPETRVLFEAIRGRHAAGDGTPVELLARPDGGVAPAVGARAPGPSVQHTLRGRDRLSALQLLLSQQMVNLSRQYVNTLRMQLDDRRAFARASPPAAGPSNKGGG